MKHLSSRYLPFLLAALLFLFPRPARAELAITGAWPTDVTPSGFCVLFVAPEPATPAITIFADPEGQTDITKDVEVTPFPLSGRNPAALPPAGYFQDEANRALAARQQALGLMKIQVRGVRPGATSYFRLTATNTAGETAVWPAEGLAAVTTATENSFLADARGLFLTLTNRNAPLDASGWVVSAASGLAMHPVSAVFGDGADANQAWVNLAGLFGADGRNWPPADGALVTLTIHGPADGPLLRTLQIVGTRGFSVAVAEPVTLDLTPEPIPPGSLDMLAMPFDRRSGVSTYQVRLANPDPSPLFEPVQVEVRELGPEGVTLMNPSGVNGEGQPFLDYTGLLGERGRLDQGEASAPRLWSFADPTASRILLHTVTLSTPEDLSRDVIAPWLAANASVNADTGEFSLTLDVDDDDTGLDWDTLSITVDGRDVTASAVRSGKTIRFAPSANLEGGHHAITASITDRAGNVATWESFADVTDITAPIITLDTPADGAVLFTPKVTVAGHVNEQWTTVTINGAPAAMTGERFSLPDIPLTRGPNTLTITATDYAGNITTLTRTVRHALPPAVTISATPDLLLAGSSATLSWEATNVDQIMIDNGVGAVPAKGSLTVYPGATTTYTITATGPDGEATANAQVQVSNRHMVDIVIEQPSHQEILTTLTTEVSGRIRATTPEIGVVINGKPAEVIDGRFFLNGLQLAPGENSIEAAAVSMDGSAADNARVIVTADPSLSRDGGRIDLHISQPSGIAPFTTKLTADLSLPVAPYTAHLKAEGPGKAAITTTGNTGFGTDFDISFDTPGLYALRYTVHDLAGNAHTREASVAVHTSGAFDTLLRGKWLAMWDALRNGKTEEALRHLTHDARDRFHALFAEFPGRMDAIADAVQSIQYVDQQGDTVRYRIRKYVVENGRPTTVSSYVYFRKDTDGIWRLSDW